MKTRNALAPVVHSAPVWALRHKVTVAGVFAGLAIAAALPVRAQSLQELLQAAQGYDATFLSAVSQFEASRARAAQADAGLLPQVSLSGGVNLTNSDSSLPGQDRTTNAQNLTLGASQPLYRPANRLAVEQAQQSLVGAEAQLRSAEQELVVRTAQTYFDVLAAEDNLAFVKAQKTAVEQQLAAAKRNFEVGTSTITDTREAEARFDLVRAQEIAADNDLRVKKLALDQLVGRTGTQPWILRTGATLPLLQPDSVDAWVTRAHAEHPQIRQIQAAMEIAQLETRRAQAGRLPTVDATAQYQVARGYAASAATYARTNNATIGVQFNLPLYTGGAVQNRIAEALALEEKSRTDLEAAKRGIAQATRSAYFGVVSGTGQVRALEAAEASSQSALEANQLGYQVGVRINIDVLNAQSQLFQTKASLAKARYDVLVGGLRLRQASGVLTADDVQPINSLLAAR